MPTGALWLLLWCLVVDALIVRLWWWDAHSRWRRLQICCGPVLQCGAWDLRWSIGSTFLSFYRLSLCILSMVAWLSDGWCQESSKQNTKTCVLGDNRKDMHYSYWCFGGTYWPASTRSGDSRWGEVSGTSSLGSGLLVLPSHQLRTQ